MVGISILLAMMAAPASQAAKPKPYVLVISDGAAMTRMNYPTLARCVKARDEVRKQTTPPAATKDRIYGPSRTSAYCVPR